MPFKNHSSNPPPASAILVLDGPAIDRALRRIAHEILEANPQPGALALVGIPSRGVELANRLAHLISEFGGTPVPAGVIDVSMHRDDLHARGGLHPVQPSRLPAELAGKTLVLVDDVLFSGRTCRAALDAISSFGRPAKIQYATLIDRGHRELPIRADFVGKNLPTHSRERVYVRLQGPDPLPDSVWIDRSPA